jgi:diadenylate cyclase
LIIGILIFLLVVLVSGRLGLQTLHWVLLQAIPLVPFALVVMLLPELRQTIEGIGRIGQWTQQFGAVEGPRAEAKTIEEIVNAVAELANGRIGAIIVVEKNARLDEIASNGVALNARLSHQLLVSIFFEGNPLHDGAVIVRGDAILAAACRLPLSESSRIDHTLHMRHRAAIGVTESLDCLSIVVSEERGTISVVSDGRLRKLASQYELRDVLIKSLRESEGEKPKKVREKKAPAESRR